MKCKKHDHYYDNREGCVLCLGEIATKRINKIELIKALVEDWLPQIGMTITFREMFYEIMGEPNPEWLGDRILENTDLEWITNNEKLIKEGKR